jgi:hypothetical protein
MLVIYRDGEIQNQVVAWGGDRERRLEGKSGCGNHRRKSHLLRIVPELEAVLVLCGAIIPTTLPGGDRNRRDEDSGDESDSERQRSRYGSRGATGRAAKTKNDEDSGSELDM